MARIDLPTKRQVEEVGHTEIRAMEAVHIHGAEVVGLTPEAAADLIKERGVDRM